MLDISTIDTLRSLISPFVMSINAMDDGSLKIVIGYHAPFNVIDQMKALLTEIPACHTVKDAEAAQEKYRDLMYYLDTINRIAHRFRGEPVTLEFHLGDGAEKFFEKMAKEIVKLESRTGIHEILAQTMIAAGTPPPRTRSAGEPGAVDP